LSEVNKGLTESYNGLMERAKDLLTLQSTTAVVYWDLETKMPPKGIQLRSQQLALLQKIGHRMLTDPEIRCDQGQQGLRQPRPASEEKRPPREEGVRRGDETPGGVGGGDGEADGDGSGRMEEG
jgi:hypothetical protein